MIIKYFDSTIPDGREEAARLMPFSNIIPRAKKLMRSVKYNLNAIFVNACGWNLQS
jgi:hypothetical protein